MTKDEARALIAEFNDPHVSRFFETYTQMRERELKNALCIAQDLREIQLIQGAIREIRRFATLKDEISQILGKK